MLNGIYLFCAFAIFSIGCSKKEKDEKEPPVFDPKPKPVILEGECPSKEFFMNMKSPENTYVLELHYKKCTDFLKKHAAHFDTSGMEKAIEKRKWNVVEGLSDCALRWSPIESCVRNVMINSARFRWITPQLNEYEVKTIVKAPVGEEGTGKSSADQQEQNRRDKEKEKQIFKAEEGSKDRSAAPRDARSTAQSSGQGGAGAGVSRDLANKLAEGLSGNWRAEDIHAETIDWKKVCTFTKEDIENSGQPEDTVALLSAECLRMTAKWGASVQDRSPRSLALLILAGESIPLYQKDMDDHRSFIEARPPRGEKYLVGGNSGRRGISIRQGAATVSGKLDPNEVRAVLRAHRNEIHHCYQKGLLQKDRLAGNVRVEFYINAQGRAYDCRVEENLAIAEVGKCICTRLQTWRFPTPEGGLAKVSYSWTLQPGD